MSSLLCTFISDIFIMMKYFLAATTALLAVLAACNTSSREKPATLKITVQDSFYRKLEGFIGNMPVTMDLTKDDSVLTGSYYYDRIGMPLAIRGEISQDGNFSFFEYNEQQEETGRFTGHFSSDSTVEGTWWATVKNDKSLPFKLSTVTKGVATFTYETRFRENCKHANIRRENSSHKKLFFYDTLCTTLTLDLLHVTALTAAASEKINTDISRLFCGAGIGESTPRTIEELLQTVNDVEEGEGYELSIGATPVTNDKNILCIAISQDSYGYGAAHPLSQTHYYNFDIRTGKQLSLDEILAPGYKAKLDQAGRKIFFETHSPEGWFISKEDFSLPNNFAITPGGLLFLFNQYEIGPYAMGMPEVFIPYKNISDLINAQSMIGIWKRN